jgi:glyoxylase-like metal-dependent hydrolase (beta-lactamase superfamily II)
LECKIPEPGGANPAADFPGGSSDDLVASIRGKLYVLPEETRVIPGHGDETTIGHECVHNPFVRA